LDQKNLSTLPTSVNTPFILLQVFFSILIFGWKMTKGMGMSMFVFYFIFVAISLGFEYHFLHCPI
jgi:sodium/potassium/calcium exchanger 2